MATTIPDEFNIILPTFQYNEVYSADPYTQGWRAAMSTRLQLTLVSRTWYKIASEFFILASLSEMIQTLDHLCHLSFDYKGTDWKDGSNG